MRVPRIRWFVFSFATAYAALAAAAPPYEPGDLAFVAEDAALSEPGKAIGALRRGDAVHIEAVRDANVFVRAAKAGWVTVDHLLTTDAAIECCNQRLASNPRDAHSYAARGALQRQAGRIDAGLGDLKVALDRNPTCATAYFHRGRLWLDVLEFEKAVADQTAAILCNPQFYLAYYARGLAWKGRGCLELATHDLEQAARLAPDFAEVYDVLGDMYLENGASYRGVAYLDIADYTRLIRHNPSDARAYLNRSEAWRAAGEEQRAVADFVKAARLDRKLAAAFGR